MAVQLLLMCVFKLGYTHSCLVCVCVCVLRGCERLLAKSTSKAGKQAQQWLSPVVDVIALPGTHRPCPLPFNL